MTSGDVAAYLPDPDFTCTPGDCVQLLGIRPVRKPTFRLETERIGQKAIVHNYGHGGAGITMSWGCAVEVLRLVRLEASATTPPVAVLGAGVMGLTAAKLLRNKGFPVRILAAARNWTTSDIAGGQWCPSFVDHDGSTEGRQVFERILTNAFQMHKDRIGMGYGVSKRINFSKNPRSDTSFKKVPTTVVPQPTEYARLPFAHINQKGYGYQTLLVEPPIFLKKLRDELHHQGVTFVEREFESKAEVLSLTERIIVNCTGLGSRLLFDDKNLDGLKGQLVLVKAQRNLDYLYSSDYTYVFPREDHVVVGGSYEYAAYDPLDPLIGEGILQLAKRVFAGEATPDDPPPWALPLIR